MKALVFSDSHGYIKNMIKAIDHFKDEIDIIIHLGDYVDDVSELLYLYDIPIYNVAGNNDFTNIPNEKILNIENNKIFITHGHEYNVYFGADRIYYRLKEIGANIGLYGHSHTPFALADDDIIILNPGSISYPRRFPNPSFAILCIDENISYKFYKIEDDMIENFKI